jgi:RNA polymerase sigma-70 factor (ECF subfamily)
MSADVDRPVQDGLDAGERVRFERLVLPHLDAAFNLARWLLRDRVEAEDAAQEAMLRAFRFFRGYQGGDARAWLLQIVRNTSYTRLQKTVPADSTTEFIEDLHPQADGTPEALAIAGEDRDRLMRALESLPAKFREVLVLREFEGCSYKEIATIMEVPIGTVMSTLARAREKLQRGLTATDGSGARRGGGRS